MGPVRDREPRGRSLRRQRPGRRAQDGARARTGGPVNAHGAHQLLKRHSTCIMKAVALDARLAGHERASCGFIAALGHRDLVGEREVNGAGRRGTI